MLKFLISVFVIFFVLPSVIFSVWAYFSDKKEAKNRKAPRPLTHAQMMALLEPDGKPAQRPSQKVERPAEKKQVEQPRLIIVKQPPIMLCLLSRTIVRKDLSAITNSIIHGS